MTRDKDIQWLESAGFKEGENASGIKEWTKNIENDMLLTVMRHIGDHAWKCRAEWLPPEERTCKECFWCVGYGDTTDMAVADVLSRFIHVGYVAAEAAEHADDEVTTIRQLTDAEKSVLENEFGDYWSIKYPKVHMIAIPNASSVLVNAYIIGLQVETNGIAWASLIAPKLIGGSMDILELALKRTIAWCNDIGSAVCELKASIKSLTEITTRNQKTSPEALSKKRRGTRQRS